MIVDKNYCMRSFLQFRFVEDERYCFSEKAIPKRYCPSCNRVPVNSSEELLIALGGLMGTIDFNRTAIMLSGGIDSALLAKFMPRGSRAYTLKCDAPGAIDETHQAQKYADECGLDLHIVDVTWDDYIKLSPALVLSMGQPVHSIEPQICKAAMQAKEDGYDALIFGETADIIYDTSVLSVWQTGQTPERYRNHAPYVFDAELVQSF